MNVQETLKRNRRCIATTLRELQMPNPLKDIVLNFVGKFHTFEDLHQIFRRVCAVLNTNVRPFKFEEPMLLDEEETSQLDTSQICCVTDGIFYSPADYTFHQRDADLSDDDPEIFFTEEIPTASTIIRHKKHPACEIRSNSREGTITYGDLLDVVAEIETYVRMSHYKPFLGIDSDHIYLEGFHEGARERGGITFDDEKFGTKVWLVHFGS